MAPLTASDVGEITVEDYGYGLGPPNGILVLRYPPAATIPDFPEGRDDFLHQVFFSPDGALVVRRGETSHFLSSTEMLWVRRGAVIEVRGLGLQTVLRTCVREAPARLTRHGAAVLAPSRQVRERILALARPGVSQAEGLQARAEILEGLCASPAAEVEHAASAPMTPARAVARALRVDPADPTGLTAWAEQLHVSPKTLQRDIERQFGLTFTTLRTQIRLRAALALLPGLSVTETAHRVGYGSASAFVAAFTREFGQSPGRYGQAPLAG
ncbi:AraC family transcriptional regulator [Nocardioides sp. AE5]|uniref:helix-turn-helix transcriptional regulator n=1 Tax=Nocardioides sp. AE5 TaxID=2962573 RepID=UPI002882194B|nr:AraC family transcriptional regulator [Nocardioides sp. AE5]MDT0200884.1 AraC family transcriptional regulator [Nocardioides sp. AE5]